MLEVNQFVNQMVVNGRTVDGDEVITRNLANDRTEVRGFGRPVTGDAAKEMVDDYYDEIKAAYRILDIIEKDERYVELKENEDYQRLRVFLDPKTQTVSGVFGKEIIMQILSQRHCEGIRYVVGKDSNNNLNTVILFGVAQISDELTIGTKKEPTVASTPLGQGDPSAKGGNEPLHGEVHEHSYTLAQYLENKPLNDRLSDVLFDSY